MKVTPFTRDLLKALREDRRTFMSEALERGMTKRQAETFAKIMLAERRSILNAEREKAQSVNQ